MKSIISLLIIASLLVAHTTCEDGFKYEVVDLIPGDKVLWSRGFLQFAGAKSDHHYRLDELRSSSVDVGSFAYQTYCPKADQIESLLGIFAGTKPGPDYVLYTTAKGDLVSLIKDQHILKKEALRTKLPSQIKNPLVADFKDLTNYSIYYFNSEKSLRYWSSANEKDSQSGLNVQPADVDALKPMIIHWNNIRGLYFIPKSNPQQQKLNNGQILLFQKSKSKDLTETVLDLVGAATGVSTPSAALASLLFVTYRSHSVNANGVTTSNLEFLTFAVSALREGKPFINLYECELDADKLGKCELLAELESESLSAN